nr:zinc finger MYM-type protein 1-like [Tanacetum cinerariifolium]
GLVSYFVNYKETRYENAISQAEQIPETIRVEPEFPIKRTPCRKKHFDEILNSKREQQSSKENFRTDYFLILVDDTNLKECCLNLESALMNDKDCDIDGNDLFMGLPIMQDMLPNGAYRGERPWTSIQIMEFTKKMDMFSTIDEDSQGMFGMYFCAPKVDIGKHLKPLRNDFELANFVKISYDNGCKVELYAEHHGYNVLDGVTEEVVDEELDDEIEMEEGKSKKSKSPKTPKSPKTLRDVRHLMLMLQRKVVHLDYGQDGCKARQVSKLKPWYVVHTSRVIVPTSRYVVPTDRVIVATGRDIWNAVKARFDGNAESKKMRKSMLKQEFSEFRIGEAKGLHKGYDRMQKILSQLNQLKAKPVAEYINLSSKTGSYKFGNVIEDVLQSFVTETEPEQQLAYEDFEQIEKLDLEEMDLKWQMAMLSVRVHKFEQKAGRNIDFDKKESARFNKKKVRCYKCQQRGHFARECRAKEGNDKQKYSSFKIKEIRKKEENSKALITVDTLVDWTNHDSKSDGVITAQEFGMIAGCDSKDAFKEGAAKLYNLITGAN